MFLEAIREKNFHNDIQTTEYRREDARAYFIPFERGQNAFQAKTESDRFLNLNGDWEFYFSKDIGTETAVDFNRTISVPSNWQMKGYDGNWYLNYRYPFPFTPPHIYRDNPCGFYKKSVIIERRENERYFIVFEGVDSCLYLFVNGTLCGYGQISHSMQEYDITPYVLQGKNEIVVAVLKYCSGSYFESQDKLRMSGIFRDVYILKRDEQRIVDYTIKQFHHENFVDLGITFKKTGTGVIACKLYYGKDLLCEQTSDGEISFRIHNPNLYSAEFPLRYRLLMEYNGEAIGESVALIDVKIKDSVFYINGKNVKLKGVNRHDSYPDSGYTESYEKIIKDIMLMKEANVNAIRTSHYPPSPLAMSLFEQYGFYILDEADLETHATTMVSGEYREEDFDILANDPKYEKIYCERIKHLYERDKNRGNVVMWSLGNEAGWGRNFILAAKYIKANDSRPIHYESLYGVNKDYGVLDVFSKMYPSVEWIRENYLNADIQKPFILCEFAHSMGNGPGGLKDYYDLIFSDDRIIGAFVWEWCDHAVLTYRDEQKRFLYGGNFGEEYHDGNFCVDGLVYPDRIPHVGYYELKNIIKPIAVDRDFVLHNRYDFRSLTGLEVEVELEEKGKQVYRTVLNGFDNVIAGGACKLNLDFGQYMNPLTTVKFSYFIEGKMIGFDQYLLQDGRYETVTPFNCGRLKASKRGKQYSCSGTDFTYLFDERKGFFEKLRFGGREVNIPKRFFNVFRAPTDNDCFEKQNFYRWGLDKAEFFADKTEYYEEDGCVVFRSFGKLLSKVVEKIADISIVSKIYPDGTIGLCVKAEVNERIKYLPRFGMVLELPYEFDSVEYFGMGDRESYIDKCASSCFGYFRSGISEQHEPYIKPQENSSHCNTRYIKVYGDNDGMKIVPAKPVSFRVGYFSDEQLAQTENNADLHKEATAKLYLDYKMSGVGSNSCGPELDKKYQVDEKNIVFDFEIRFYNREA